MRPNSIFKIAISALFILALASCSSDKKEQQGEQNDTQGMIQGTTNTGTTTLSDSKGSVAGIEWRVPKGWDVGPEKPMRAATYLLDAGDLQAECAVFFFGQGQGGDVQANIDRWIGQVKQPDGTESKGKARTLGFKTECCQVTTIEVAGTYLMSSGPMMQTSEEKPGYVLIGAIAPGPEGNVFFKLTGPERTINKWRQAYIDMLKSVVTK